jgi:hypothetical protein
MTRRKLRQIVAQAAAKQLPALPPRERADLIEGIALLLTDASEKDLARHTVGLIRQAEEHQLKLLQQLARSQTRKLKPEIRNRKSA